MTYYEWKTFNNAKKGNQEGLPILICVTVYFYCWVTYSASFIPEGTGCPGTGGVPCI